MFVGNCAWHVVRRRMAESVVVADGWVGILHQLLAPPPVQQDGTMILPCLV